MPASPETILQLERCANRAVPHGGPKLYGWSVGLLGSTPRRLGSTTTFGAVPDDPAPAIQLVESLYRARVMTPTFRLTPLDNSLDQLLAGRGYLNDAGARVMAASLGERVHRASAPTSDRIDADWIEDLGRLSGMAKDRLETLRVSFAQLDQPVVTVRLPGRAVGLLVEDHPWAGIFDVAVHPSYRRQGLGSAVVDTLLATATGHGVSHIYLQVHPSNHGAVSLYERRSFTEVYAYTYRSLR